jgi:hypothetical protein
VTPVSVAPRPERAGRPPCCPREVTLRILGLKNAGHSLRQIAEVLNAEGIPTPLGRPQWNKWHVDGVLHRLYTRELETEAFV